MLIRILPRLPILAVVLLVLLAGCSDDAPRSAPESAPPVADAAPVAAPPSALEVAASLGVRNPHEPSPGLLTAGQITREQLDGLAQAGYGTFVSLRLPDEDGTGWEEAYAAERGVTFTRVPVTGAEGLTLENAEALDQVLDAAGDAPVVLYCGSANRAGAMLALRARWLEGATVEGALAFGRAAGMLRLEPTVSQLLAAAGDAP